MLHLARTRYSGTNHTHMSELLSEREGIDITRSTLRRLLVNAVRTAHADVGHRSTECGGSGCLVRVC